MRQLAVRVWRPIQTACVAAGCRLSPHLLHVADVFVQIGRQTPGEKQLDEASGFSREATLALRTRARVDVGMWFRRGRVWLYALPGELALLAHGRRPYRERIPYGELTECAYNHVMAELMLAPAEGRPVRRLGVPPLEGAEVLALIRHRADGEHAGSTVDRSGNRIARDVARASRP